ncbi:hypothetical protein BpHYR1_000631, partial [Brachionus plicatilis]
GQLKALELGFDLPEKIKLADLKKLVSVHPAFNSVNKLEILGKKYGIKVIFIPKYHCELNPIEEEFWRCLFAYKSGVNYANVLKTYFSGKSKAKTAEH